MNIVTCLFSVLGHTQNCFLLDIWNLRVVDQNTKYKDREILIYRFVCFKRNYQPWVGKKNKSGRPQVLLIYRHFTLFPEGSSGVSGTSFYFFPSSGFAIYSWDFPWLFLLTLYVLISSSFDIRFFKVLTHIGASLPIFRMKLNWGCLSFIEQFNMHIFRNSENHSLHN